MRILQTDDLKKVQGGAVVPVIMTGATLILLTATVGVFLSDGGTEVIAQAGQTIFLAGLLLFCAAMYSP